jgi:glycosyltransferase involved in cell wall biosynthesis
MALGVPSAVFEDSPGIVEHVDDGRTGFVVRDVPELTSLLERLAADPGLREQVGRSGSEAVRATYTLEAMAASYSAVYRSAVARAGVRR